MEKSLDLVIPMLTLYRIWPLTIHLDLRMGAEYVSQFEVKEHEAAMQRLVEDDKKERV